MKTTDAVMQELHKAKDDNAKKFKTLAAYVAHLSQAAAARKGSSAKPRARVRKVAS